MPLNAYLKFTCWYSFLLPCVTRTFQCCSDVALPDFCALLLLNFPTLYHLIGATEKRFSPMESASFNTPHSTESSMFAYQPVGPSGVQRAESCG